MKKFKMTTAIVLVALAGIAGTVQAAEHSVYIGIECQPLSNDDAGNVTYFSDNLLNNSGSEIVYISCPIVRRNVFNTDGTARAYAMVVSHNSETLRCDFHSRTRDARQAGFRSSTTRSSSLTELNLDVNRSGPQGTYSLFCTLPPGGRIYSYGIEEFDIGSTVIVNRPVDVDVGLN